MKKIEKNFIIEYFSEKEEKGILSTSQYEDFKNAINKEFLGK